MNELNGPIYHRQDGGYDVTHNGSIYGPIYQNRPDQFYTWQQVLDYAAANPELVVDIPAPNLDSIKASLRAQVEADIPVKRKAGFVLNDVTYQADQGVTEAVNGVLTALSAGVPVGFPLPWRSGDNQRPSWPNQAAFTAFAGQLLAFVNGLYQAAWNTKDAIAAAATPEQAQASYDAWKEQ